MKIDLHIHTDISDGSLNIFETLVLAKKNGLTHIAITNHDTVEGLQQAIYIGTKMGIKVIPGVEISAVDKITRKKIHILGYNFNLKAPNITKLCQPLLEQRLQKSLWQIEQLIAHGYNINKDEINRERAGRASYKQHIMSYLVKQGYTDNIYSPLYEELFKGRGICAGEIEYVDVTEAVRAIKADGGIAVLAHPGYQSTYCIVEQLISAGLDGIELYHEMHTADDHEKIKQLADKNNLILTGGSDFHGDYGTTTELGQLLCPIETLSYFESQEDKYVHFMKSLAYQSGEKLRQVATRQKQISLKEDELCNLVTNFDIEIEKFIVAKIKSEFPAHGFITEENTVEASSNCSYTWIIDPIDGTTNFISFGQDFAVSIALYKNQQPYIGVVYDVMADDLYLGITRKGAWINDLPLERKPPIENLSEAIVDCSLNTINRFILEHNIKFSALINHIRGHRSYGVASIAICKLATGLLSAYISAKLSIWDYAAAAIILTEMQGSYSILSSYGRNLESHQKLVFIACENRLLLQQLQDKLMQLREEK
ncbi:inositol monophosphatase family protein [Dendrosporobacter sp. 1207_IL3150]|uniref:inositol monophosphatase family protein n=1 Tax=Dendrosporobacter sp. 1207_IL3150 TaxID=3084054 RepID=UPI002FDA209D